MKAIFLLRSSETAQPWPVTSTRTTRALAFGAASGALGAEPLQRGADLVPGAPEPRGSESHGTLPDTKSASSGFAERFILITQEEGEQTGDPHGQINP